MQLYREKKPMITSTAPLISLFGCAKPTMQMDSKTCAELMLIESTQRGDLAAFNELIEAHQDVVYRQAFWILGDVQAAEDAAQEAFFRAYRSIHSYNGLSFRAWVLKIASNYCLDQIRKQKRHAVVSIEREDEAGEELGEYDTRLIDPSASPDQAVERAELGEVIQRCLMRLDPKYRVAITMIDLEEMNYQEAAHVLGMPIGSFKSRLFRARKLLCEEVRKAELRGLLEVGF